MAKVNGTTGSRVKKSARRSGRVLESRKGASIAKGSKGLRGVQATRRKAEALARWSVLCAKECPRDLDPLPEPVMQMLKVLFIKAHVTNDFTYIDRLKCAIKETCAQDPSLAGADC